MVGGGPLVTHGPAGAEQGQAVGIGAAGSTGHGRAAAMVTEQQVRAWVDGYLRAWTSSRKDIAVLFTPRAEATFASVDIERRGLARHRDGRAGVRHPDQCVSLCERCRGTTA
ncbi:hypothetical protein GCM10010442_50800 [Kitasatospora kifunensis]